MAEPQDRTEQSNVVWIDEQLDLEWEATVQTLGGKGANLAEMVRLDLPVPPAFVITTDACRSVLAGARPEGLDQQIRSALAGFAPRAGRAFGSADRPLLVSVRSGAPVSMPGMMDTVLNVGINAAVVDALAAESGDAGFAARTWLRFCRMYAEIVLGIERAEVEAVVDEVAAAGAVDGTGRPDAATARAAVARLQERAAPAGGIPDNPEAQVLGAVEAVFGSWHSPRARAFRAAEGIDDTLGTAVTVQAMVFGNLDDRSGTGVLFTRDPATGESEPHGDYLVRAQGEDVVAGTHEVEGLDALARHEPEVHAELLAIAGRLEHHYRDMCDIEFTLSAGTLHILQTRVGRRSPQAAVRLAIAMAEDPAFPLTRAEAVARIEPATLEAAASVATVETSEVALASGIAASPGVGVGVVCCDPDRAAERVAAGDSVVLIRTETSPADVQGMVVSSALVTSLGGAVSHAAVVARSWGIPAATGLSAMQVFDDHVTIGDLTLAEGEIVTVDGSTGSLYRGNVRAGGSGSVPEVDVIRRWAAELGIEPGQALVAPDEQTANGAGGGAITPLAVLRAVQLKGLCALDVAAAVLGTSTDVIEGALADLGERVADKGRGWAITPDGRQWLTEQLAAELASTDTAAVDAVYQQFLPLNSTFKHLVTDWQASAQDDAAIAVMTAGLQALHRDLSPLVEASAQITDRLGPYRQRFEHALGAVVSGDVTMLASPLKDSYHTVWFEYHEELIHLAGRDRLTEEQNEANKEANRR